MSMAFHLIGAFTCWRIPESQGCIRWPSSHSPIPKNNKTSHLTLMFECSLVIIMLWILSHHILVILSIVTVDLLSVYVLAYQLFHWDIKLSYVVMHNMRESLRVYGVGVAKKLVALFIYLRELFYWGFVFLFLLSYLYELIRVYIVL